MLLVRTQSLRIYYHRVGGRVRGLFRGIYRFSSLNGILERKKYVKPLKSAISNVLSEIPPFWLFLFAVGLLFFGIYKGIFRSQPIFVRVY